VVEVKWPVRHSGRLYSPGEVITDITVEQATALVLVGAADWQRLKPTGDVVSKTAEPMSEPVAESTGGVDWEAEIRKYHRGFGNYDIPGVGIVKGKEAAVEALRQSLGK